MGKGVGEGRGSGVSTGLQVVGDEIVRADSLFDGGKEGKNELKSLFMSTGILSREGMRSAQDRND